MSGVKLESAPETRFSGWVFLDVPGKGVHTRCPRGTCSLGSPSGLYMALTSHFIAEQTETQGNGAKTWGAVCVSPQLAILSSQVFPRAPTGPGTLQVPAESIKQEQHGICNPGVGKGREGGSLFIQQTLVY